MPGTAFNPVAHWAWSATHAEYRRAKEKKLPIHAFIKDDRKVKRKEGTEAFLKELDGEPRQTGPCNGCIRLCMANSYSRGDWQIEKPVAMGLAGVMLETGRSRWSLGVGPFARRLSF